MKYRWSCRDIFKVVGYAIEADSKEELGQKVQKFLDQHKQLGTLKLLDPDSVKKELLQEKKIDEMRAQLKTFSAERKSET